MKKHKIFMIAVAALVCALICAMVVYNLVKVPKPSESSDTGGDIVTEPLPSSENPADSVGGKENVTGEDDPSGSDGGSAGNSGNVIASATPYTVLGSGVVNRGMSSAGDVVSSGSSATTPSQGVSSTQVSASTNKPSNGEATTPDEGEISPDEYPYANAETVPIRNIALGGTRGFESSSVKLNGGTVVASCAHNSSEATIDLLARDVDVEDTVALSLRADLSDHMRKSRIEIKLDVGSELRMGSGGCIYLISDSGRYYKLTVSDDRAFALPPGFVGYIVIPYSQFELAPTNLPCLNKISIRFADLEMEASKKASFGSLSLILDPSYAASDPLDASCVSMTEIYPNNYFKNTADVMDAFNTLGEVSTLGSYRADLARVSDGRYTLKLDYDGSKNGVRILAPSSAVGYQAFSIEVDNSFFTSPVRLRFIAVTTGERAYLKSGCVLYMKDKNGTCFEYTNTDSSTSMLINGGGKYTVVLPFAVFEYENGNTLNAADVKGIDVMFASQVSDDNTYIKLDDFAFVRSKLPKSQIFDASYPYLENGSVSCCALDSDTGVSANGGVRAEVSGGRLKIGQSHTSPAATVELDTIISGQNKLAISFTVDNGENTSDALIIPEIKTSSGIAGFISFGAYYKLTDTAKYKLSCNANGAVTIGAGERATIVIPFDQLAYKLNGRYINVETVSALRFVMHDVAADPSKSIYVDNIEYICRKAMPSGMLKQLPIGGGGYVTGIVIHPLDSDIKYIRTDVGGAYRWDPDNNRWIPITNSFGNNTAQYGIDGIAVDPNNKDTVYMCVGENGEGTHGIYRSTDRGETWNVIKPDVWFYGNAINRANGEPIAVDPNNSRVIHVAGRIGGIYRTLDGGETWENFAIDATYGNGDVRSIVVDTGSTCDGRSAVVYYAVKGTGVFRSVDGGTTYSLLEGAPASVNTLEVASDSTLYMTSDVGVYAYRNGSVSNITPSEESKLAYRAIDSDPNDPSKLIVVNSEDASESMNLGIYYSENGGATWENKNNINKKDKLGWWKEYYFSSATADIAFDPNNSSEVWFTDWYGVWATDNIKESKVDWYSKVRGHEECVIWDMATLPSGPVEFLFGTADNDGMYYEDVTEYPLMRRGCQTRFIAFCDAMPNYVLFVGADNANVEGSVCLSSDYGKSFRELEAWGTVPAEAGAMSYDDPTNIVVLPIGGVPRYTEDGGATWHDSTGAPSNSIGSWGYNNYLMADGATSGVFYYSAPDGLYLSSDKGRTWTLVNDNDDISCGQLEIVPGEAGTFFINKLGKLFLTSDGGATFSQLSPDATISSISLGKGKSSGTYALYMLGAVGGVDGLYISDDMGVSWELMFTIDKLAKFSDVEGDRQVYGRCFLGSNGLGIAIAYK